MVINAFSVGPGHVFEFQISIDLGHLHPGHPSPSSPLVLALEERGKGSVCIWRQMGVGVQDTRASTCVLLMLQRNIRGKGLQQPLKLYLLPKPLKAAEV